MSLSTVTVLCVAFYVTSVVGTVTGSTSLVTVPVLLWAGVDPRIAVATNMFGLTFMSAGGALPFVESPALARDRLAPLALLTVLGSVFGALLLLVVPPRAVPVVIGMAMLAVALFSLVDPRAGLDRDDRTPTRAAEIAAYALTFLLGIYGGFFSGGYVTLLTAVYVSMLRLSFLEAVPVTKVLNVFSSLVATGIFVARGLVDVQLGALLAVVMFAGGYTGGRVARALDNRWIRRIFFGTVVILAAKTLLYDALSAWLGGS